MNENSRFAIVRAGVLSLQALAFVVLLSLPASAGEPLHHLLGCPVPDCIGKWCPDDYCPKTEPRVCVPLCFGCDDYCGKRAPCVCVPLCFGCDDYCKKCPPKVCGGLLCQISKCGPSRQSCGCTKCDKLPCDGCAQKPAEIKPRLSADDGEQLPARPQPVPSVIVQASGFKLITAARAGGMRKAPELIVPFCGRSE